MENPKVILKVAKLERELAEMKGHADSWMETCRKLEDERDAAQSSTERIVVGGAWMEQTIATHMHRAEHFIAIEQAKINHDNGLIAVLCDSVRLCREYVKAMASTTSSTVEPSVAAPLYEQRRNFRMTKSVMQAAIDRLYAIASKRATEGVLLHRRIERLETALRRIARWHGEFPSKHYGWDYGNNGERDYMRQVALDALSTPQRDSGVERV